MRLIEAFVLVVLLSWLVQLLLIGAALTAFIRWPREALCIGMVWAAVSMAAAHPLVFALVVMLIGIILVLHFATAALPVPSESTLQLPAPETYEDVEGDGPSDT